MKAKLSENQRSILAKLAAGERLYRSQYTRGGWSAPRFAGLQKVSSSAVAGLEVRLLIKQLPYKIGSFQVDYVITDDGRAALAANVEH